MPKPDELTAADLGLTDHSGAIVYNVYENSPAGKAGILPGDFIINLDGNSIDDYLFLTRLIGDIKSGDEAEITVIRNGEIKKLTASIELRKSREELTKLYDQIWPGFTSIPLTGKMRKEYNLGELHGVYYQC